MSTIKTIATLTTALTLASPSWALAAEPLPGQPVNATCLDSEEVIIVDDADMSVDIEAREADRRHRARQRREARRAKKRQRQLEEQVAEQEEARAQAEARAREAEAELQAKERAQAEAEQARQVEEREARRRVARLEAEAAAAAGDPATAGVQLQIAASTHHDSLLWVEAAEYFAEGFDLGDDPAGAQAVAAAMEAKKSDEALAPAERESVRVRADAVLEHVPRLRRARDETRRVARAELAAGGVLLAVGAAGFGMFGAGSYLNGAAKRERARVEGLEGVDTAPLAAQERRAKGLLIGGGVVGSVGVILGGTLVGLGLREHLRLRHPEVDTGRRNARKSGSDRAGKLRAKLGPGPTALGATLTLRM
jgi:hypothetical protein